MQSEYRIKADTKLARAYVACEMGHYDAAMDLLRSAATFAWLDGDKVKHAKCVRARTQVAVALGVRHLSVVEG